ncbi:protein translocase subunit SecD [Arenimonas oryziterrae]|uniref:Protein translocase subunit SecD n=1 Tax=Arenimonas oryziterrae DSM 21050 = YC6267 TaxID=1121015 RepID=A0A091BKU5_9GAMM|nr:protein translocase subunit SecD [Arenimonas oryziterrae]KFN44920.1 hypothetical protein N789_02555 [Arenimonas oryziterrae DSM 21050 = YC6267]
MLDFPRWKYVLVALVLLFAALYAMPNLYPSDPSVQISANKGTTLDANLTTRVKGLLDTSHIPYKSAAIEGKSLIVRLSDGDVQTKASDLLRPAMGDNYTVALNLAPTVPQWLRSIGAKPMTLGLDLQGGVHFLMEVDQAAAREKRENAYVEDIRASLREKTIRYSEVSRSPAGIRVQLSSPADKTAAQNLLSSQMPKLRFEDVDATTIRVVVTPEELKAIADGAIEQNVSTLRNRINGLGVAEPIIQRQGSNRIVVQLPGVQDTAGAKLALGATATLEFRAVVDGDAATMLKSGTVPADARVYYQVTPDGQRSPILLSKRLLVSGDQLVDATPQVNQEDGRPSVSIKLDSAGGKRMLDHTLENVGNRLGIVYVERTPVTTLVDGKEVRSSKIDERVISASTIQGVFGKDFQTTGLSQDEAAALAKQLKAGALAAPVDIVEERVIGPSLGAANIAAGRKAVEIGFLLVCGLMILYYRVFGVISVLSLFTNLVLLTAVLSLLGATMTMPGIAGIVLTLGMAIDGNVLINERIREELRVGNSPIASIKAGYERAWTVILDSNVAKIIAAIALFSFGSGPVRGFAVVLFLGVLTSMFTSVTVSRALSTLVYGHGRKIKSVSVGGGF